jgi:translation initiation factor IF-2
MTDQSDKPKLGTRPPLGLKRTVETGKVKQSFSHGRSNTVVVEVKKRRILGRPGEAAPEAPKTPVPAAEAPKPAAPAPKPAPAAPKRSAADDITSRRAFTFPLSLLRVSFTIYKPSPEPELFSEAR